MTDYHLMYHDLMDRTYAIFEEDEMFRDHIQDDRIL